jgi:xanthine dehydrogenase YagR molybdenum-binding subunit
MSDPREPSALGQPLPRVDAAAKVSGGARYAADQPVVGLLHGVPVCSTVARGRVRSIDASGARAQPGVVLVLTPENMPKLNPPRADFAEACQPGEARLPLADDQVHYVGQYLALVVADTYEHACAAAARVSIRYETQPAAVTIESAMATVYAPTASLGDEARYCRGTPERAFDEAPIKLKQTYRTPTEHHHPLEPPATIAVVSGEDLVLYDSTQWVASARNVVAQTLGLAAPRVRIVSPFVGGGFGCKGSLWPHTILAAVAARTLRRPVRVAMTRQQMASSCGHRPETVQTLQVAASRDGVLQALMHSTLSRTSMVDEYCEAASNVSRFLYACAHVRTGHHLVRAHIGTPTVMRAPGEATGLFALECALDELSTHLGLDPVRLRQLNHADRDPLSGKPWSGKNLRECYRLGMEKIGWERRSAHPRERREGRFLVGLGMATASYPGYRSPGAARVRLQADGRVLVQSATQDMGTGTYTILAQTAASELGVAVAAVTVQLGDSALPPAPVSGGSMTAASVPPAVQAAARVVLQRWKALVSGDASSPLHGSRPEDLAASGGFLHVAAAPARREALAATLARHNLPFLEGEAQARPSPAADGYAVQSFGAQFSEVHVDADTGEVRVARHVSVLDVGRVLNPRTAQSQGYGGVVMGIGMALMEQTLYEPKSGQPLNDNLADYLIPTAADVGEVQIHFVDRPDPQIGEMGARGVGEIVLCGVAPAIANAVYNATGIRVRELPITPDKLLGM